MINLENKNYCPHRQNRQDFGGHPSTWRSGMMGDVCLVHFNLNTYNEQRDTVIDVPSNHNLPNCRHGGSVKTCPYANGEKSRYEQFKGDLFTQSDDYFRARR